MLIIFQGIFIYYNVFAHSCAVQTAGGGDVGKLKKIGANKTPTHTHREKQNMQNISKIYIFVINYCFKWESLLF